MELLSIRFLISSSAPSQSGFKDIVNQSENSVDANADISTLLILDEKSFAPKWTFFLDKNEIGTAIVSTPLGADNELFIVIGTAIVLPDEHESKKGRIIVMRWTSSGKVTVKYYLR